MKKFIPMMIGAFAITSSMMPMVIAKTFTDVDASHWAYSYIDELSNDGVINGYQDGRFNPSGTITKAEYLKLLVGTVASNNQLEEMQNAQNSSANWFDPYVQFATSRGIIKENYSTEELKSSVSRSEMATLMVEFANYVGLVAPSDNIEPGTKYVVKGENKENTAKPSEQEIRAAYGSNDATIVDDVDAILEKLGLVPAKVSANADPSDYVAEDDVVKNTGAVSSVFTDIATVSIEEQESILRANELGLVAGYDDGTFKPEKLMSRAEVATIVFRFGESFEKLESEVWNEPKATTVEVQ